MEVYASLVWEHVASCKVVPSQLSVASNVIGELHQTLNEDSTLVRDETPTSVLHGALHAPGSCVWLFATFSFRNTLRGTNTPYHRTPQRSRCNRPSIILPINNVEQGTAHVQCPIQHGTITELK